jgi:proteasome lid subunit RPN8/RPN11/LysM repeat protein
MSESARNTVEDHVFGRVDVEVGGFLLGRIDGTSVEVSAARPALAATSAQTHLTFTHEAWAEVLEHMDSEYPGMSIVGWYHSHPGFGCFLSDYDIFIQENFFSGPGQHALVVDPIAGLWATFVASLGKATKVDGGRTQNAALGNEGDSRADVVEMVSAESRRRVWPGILVATFATAVLVGGIAWVAGNMQGRDSASTSASARVDDANAKVGALQSQLASALASASATDGPVPSPSPTPEPLSTPMPMGLAVGSPATFSVTHTVAPGDSLWNIARKYLGSGTRFPEILRANPGLESNGLKDGTTVKVVLRGTLEGQG